MATNRTFSPLIDRQQTEIILRTSYSTIRRMEADGTLTPIKLRPTKKRAKTHYRRDQVYALINEPEPGKPRKTRERL